MFWFVISYEGAGRMQVCEGMQNKDTYLKVLQHRVLPQMRDWQPAGITTFMHDKAPCHTARICTQFIRENNIQLLDWPGNSPDLNPIENLFGILKKQLAGETITTRNAMIARVIHLWNREVRTVDYIRQLIDSMPHRIQCVIRARGGHTRY